MSLARALTTRRKEEPVTPPAYIGRAASQRAPNAKPIKRSEISLPVNLISTTNMLSYEAPDIVDAPLNQSRQGRYFSPSSLSAASTSNSDNDSDHSGSVHSHETDATSVDLSSPESAHDSFMSAPYNYKPVASPSLGRSVTSARSSHSTMHSSHSSRPSMDSNSPRIPQRSLTHSKSAHVLAHKRSVQRMGPNPPMPQPDIKKSTRDTMDMFSSVALNGPTPPPAPTTNPFGKELEQLNEAAEEFSYAVRNAEADADQAVMRAKGLVHFCANDYMDEINSLYSTAFEEDNSRYQPMVWI